jgi:glycosyltransferase involved in cell wall biosynthesis
MFLDDASTDGTREWLLSLPKDNLYAPYFADKRVGHTVLYDKGIAQVNEDIVGILHADMIIGPNYVENLLKHLQPGKVVCATRIEPPLHPEGKEKIIKDFGQDFDSLNVSAFESFCVEKQTEFKNQTTKGMFAPWVIYKKDFQAIGGHDPLFAPFPYEDSDIFQRWIMAGYKLIQSRDALVYHLTCRGHRWTEQVGKDDEFYKKATAKAARNYIRKWGSWIENDEYQHPIIKHKYDIGFVVHNCNFQALTTLEPWCNNIYTGDELGINEAAYIDVEQPNTIFDLKKRLKLIKHDVPTNDIIVEFDAAKFTQQSFDIIMQLPKIIADSGEVGEFELDIFKIKIKALTTYEQDLTYLL